MQPQPSSAAFDDDAPGFGEYLGVISKRRRWFYIVGAPIAGVAAGLALLLPDVYRSSGLIEIENKEQTLNSIAAGEETRYADQYVQSLSTIVLSDRNLAKMLQRQRLYDVQGDDGAGIDSRLIRGLRKDIDVDIVTVPILDPNTGREREIVTAFSVAYENLDPQRAHLGAKWLVEAFLQQNRADRERYAANVARFFGAEAERMRKEVADIEAKLAQFKAKNFGRLPEVAEANRNALDRTENDLRNVESQMQALRRERVFLAAQLQQAQQAAPEAASLRQLEEDYRRRSATYDESHPDMISLRRQIDLLRSGGSVAGMTLQQQLQQQRLVLNETRQRYSQDHPDVKRLMRNIEALEARIAAGETADRTLASDSPMAVQLQTQMNAVDTQLAALQTRATELRTKMNDLELRMNTAPEVEREFQIVTRDLASARAKYEELVKRQLDAEVSRAAIAGGSADKFRVASAPRAPEGPAKPQRAAIAVVGVVLGFVASLTAIIMAQLFDQTIRGVRDVREILEVTPLTTVPVIRRPRGLRAAAGIRRFATRGAAMLMIVSCLAAAVIAGALQRIL